MQEYFQARVQMWLDTIGKNVFKIQHYWCHFEFAPSRGQIHAHLLAISDFSLFFAKLHTIPSRQDKANLLAAWVEDQLGITNHPPTLPTTDDMYVS